MAEENVTPTSLTEAMVAKLSKVRMSEGRLLHCLVCTYRQMDRQDVGIAELWVFVVAS